MLRCNGPASREGEPDRYARVKFTRIIAHRFARTLTSFPRLIAADRNDRKDISRLPYDRIPTGLSPDDPATN
jgi:hypothetical protein